MALENEPQVPAVVPAEPTVTLSQKEADDLKHKAEVSSQNFERFQKEKEAREAAEARAAQLETALQSNGSFEPNLDAMKSELSDIKAKLAKTEVLERYPDLKDKWADLEEFRNLPDNKGMNLSTAAKSFMVEKGFLEPQRKGLENATGGNRAPLSVGMSTEDAANLRTSNYKKYREELKKGNIQITS